MISEHEMIALAAQGSAEAQSALVDAVLEMPSRNVCDAAEAVCAAEIIARLAASHGSTQARLKLAGILLIRSEMVKQQGDVIRSGNFNCEAISLITDMANEGDDGAAAALIAYLNGLADEGVEDAADALNLWSVLVSRKAMIAAKIMLTGDTKAAAIAAGGDGQ